MDIEGHLCMHIIVRSSSHNSIITRVVTTDARETCELDYLAAISNLSKPVGQFYGFSAERMSQLCPGQGVQMDAHFLVLDPAATDIDLCPKERRPFV